MIKLNLKARFHNKVFVTSFCIMCIMFVYEVLDLFGVIPRIPQDELVNLVKMILEIFGLLGIVVDPTTSGISDSDRAMTYYNEPKEEQK